MLRTELNIQVNLFNQEWQAYLASVRSGNYQIARAAWIGDYPDPTTFLDMWLTDGGNNSTGWSSAAYDTLIQQAGRTSDRTEREEIFQQAEAILLEELPIIPVYHYRNNYLIQPSVKGWFSNILDRHPYKFLYLEPETD
jgi:oligopeptide transport system substrate-binding protein